MKARLTFDLDKPGDVADFQDAYQGPAYRQALKDIIFAIDMMTYTQRQDIHTALPIAVEDIIKKYNVVINDDSQTNVLNT